MSRSAFTLAAPGLAVVLSIFVPAAAQAQCAGADLCSAAVCQQRQAQVHPTCDVPRSCAAVPAANKILLQQRRAQSTQCLNARQAVNNCFSAPDAGHQQAITEVTNAIATCTAKIAQP